VSKVSSFKEGAGVEARLDGAGDCTVHVGEAAECAYLTIGTV